MLTYSIHGHDTRKVVYTKLEHTLFTKFIRFKKLIIVDSIFLFKQYSKTLVKFTDIVRTLLKKFTGGWIFDFYDINYEK